MDCQIGNLEIEMSVLIESVVDWVISIVFNFVVSDYFQFCLDYIENG